MTYTATIYKPNGDVKMQIPTRTESLELLKKECKKQGLTFKLKVLKIKDAKEAKRLNSTDYSTISK